MLAFILVQLELGNAALQLVHGEAALQLVLGEVLQLAEVPQMELAAVAQVEVV
jgi:hypothetical protein